MNAVRTHASTHAGTTGTAGTTGLTEGPAPSSPTGPGSAISPTIPTRPTSTNGQSGPVGTGAHPGTGSHPGALSHDARSLHWLLANFVDEVPGVRSVAVVSSDGLLLLSSEPDPVAPRPAAGPARVSDVRMDLAAVVSGLASLTIGAARLMDGGRVRQTTVAMQDGMLFVMSISDGSLLGVHASADCDLSVIAYHMALFVGRAGHVLTPALRGELRQVMAGER